MAKYELLRQTLPQDETICFMDGVHPTHNVQPAYGWIKKGARKEIPTNTGRARLNLSGIIDVVTHSIVIQEDQTLNAESTIRFFQKIEETYPDKKRVHVFCDNALCYRNKAVKQHLKTSKVCLHFLPPYSPNPNPIQVETPLIGEGNNEMHVIHETVVFHDRGFEVGGVFLRLCNE